MLSQNRRGMPPAGSLRVSACHGQASLCSSYTLGGAEGQSPFAEGLGVSPNSPFSFPQEWRPGG